MDIKTKKATPFDLSDSAIAKISLLKESEENKFFRVYVTGGGCSGFQYGFKFDEFDQEEDAKLDFGKGVSVVLDHMSYPYNLSFLVHLVLVSVFFQTFQCSFINFAFDLCIVLPTPVKCTTLMYLLTSSSII